MIRGKYINDAMRLDGLSEERSACKKPYQLSVSGYRLILRCLYIRTYVITLAVCIY